jgi:hypothetical protein
MTITFSDLSDDAITDRLLEIHRGERAMLVECLRGLVELEQRRTALALGFSSLFTYCVEVLRYSKGSTYRRTTAAKLLARFPVIADYLADGRLTLTKLLELREVLDEEHLVEIMDRAAGCTEEEVKELVVELRPRPAPPDLLMKLPTQRNASSGSTPEATVLTSPPASVPVAPAPPPAPAPERRPSGRVEPIAPQTHVLRVTVSSAFVKDLETVRQALSHKFPAGGLEEVLHECVRVTLQTIERRRRGSGKKKWARTPPPGSSDVPAAVRDEVWRRDEGRCGFIGSGGRRCNSDHQVQLHHLDPRAMGGLATADRLGLRCRAHNVYEAERDFGRRHVALKVAARRNRGTPPARRENVDAEAPPLFGDEGER